MWDDILTVNHKYSFRWNAVKWLTDISNLPTVLQLYITNKESFFDYEVIKYSWCDQSSKGFIIDLIAPGIIWSPH